MLPRVTDAPRGVQQAAASRFDAVLFDQDGWWCLDARNRRVAGVRAASLDAALGFVGVGRVASVVGRLAPGVRVVDVDAEGLVGHAVAEQIVAWADNRDVWVLVRPSGGADGRSHVFLVGADEDELGKFVDELRTRWSLSSSKVDVRRDVRPLTAPHRSGVHTVPYGDLGDLERGLHRALARAVARQTVPVLSEPATERGSVALTPVRRRVPGDLPAEWATYVVTGVAPAFREGGDATRSAVERVATARMVQAGWTAPQAWAVIQSSHATAFQRAKASYRRWVRTAWNHAVKADDAYQPIPATAPDVAAAVHGARLLLVHTAWGLEPRQRHAFLTVGHTVLDRMERAGVLQVPVPERDLVADTGIADRRTIRVQLGRLHGAVGLLHTETFTPANPRSSYEFEITAEPSRVPLIDPPSFHTPWHGISTRVVQAPRPTGTLLRHLPQTPTALPRLCQLALLTSSPTATPTPRQLRTLRAALTHLQSLGLAECNADGQWHRTDAPLPSEVLRADQEAQDVLRARIEAERVAWRSRRGTSWDAARAAAVKRDRARQKAWWGGLTREEQAARREVWSTRFAALPLVEQDRVRDELAARSVAEGVHPEQRRRQWLRETAREVLEDRAAVRAAEFRHMPEPLQAAYVASWSGYRARWGVQQSPSRPSLGRTSPVRIRDDDGGSAVIR